MESSQKYAEQLGADNKADPVGTKKYLRHDPNNILEGLLITDEVRLLILHIKSFSVLFLLTINCKKPVYRPSFCTRNVDIPAKSKTSLCFATKLVV